tara:strand:- start:129147 stop:129356 length:210 start_codon:yes stop_codon:yes gene_type:complete
VKVSAWPSSDNARGWRLNASGIASSGCCKYSVNCFLPSFCISDFFSSTTTISPLLITPMRSAISSASSM